MCCVAVLFATIQSIDRDVFVSWYNFTTIILGPVQQICPSDAAIAIFTGCYILQHTSDLDLILPPVESTQLFSSTWRV